MLISQCSSAGQSHRTSPANHRRRSTITPRSKIESLHLDYPKIIEAHVILEVEKYRHSAEVVLVCSNHITIEACEETDDMYAAIDAVIDKVARQMRKYKTRLMRKHRPRKDVIEHFEEQVLHPEPSEDDEHAAASGRADGALSGEADVRR